MGSHVTGVRIRFPELHVYGEGESLSGLVIAMAVATACAAADRHYEGLAYSRGDGRVLYREEHWVYEASGVPTRLVLYRCPSGPPFARKVVRDVSDAFAPDFDLQDERDGYREGVRKRAGGREVYVQKNAGAPEQFAALPSREDAVIDAGFDAYVRGHWDALAGGHRLRVPFLVPSRLGYLDLTLNGTSESIVVDGQPATNLRMSLDAWFGFIAPSMDLTYRQTDHRLRRFEGISNVHDGAGGQQKVRIEFPPNLEFPPAAQQDLDAAAATPLVGRCPP